MGISVKTSASLLAVVEGKNETMPALLKAVESIPSADWLHIDAMDGKFVPQRTVFADEKWVKHLSGVSDKFIDVHYMGEKPLEDVQRYASAGADSFTFHIEAGDLELVDKIKLIKNSHGRRLLCGLAVNPQTPVSSIKKALGKVDLVLVMSVEPGRGGQVFDECALDKIRELSRMIYEKKLNTIIEVDGGIKKENAYKVINAAGGYPVNLVLVSGSGIFNSSEPDAAAGAIKKCIAIGADHGAFELKNAIRDFLRGQSIGVIDAGTFSAESVDYPDFAKIVASAVDSDNATKGILMCGTGIGMCMCANKFENVRAGVVNNAFDAEMLKCHNNGNILIMGQRTMHNAYGSEAFTKAKELVNIWLKTKCPTDARHLRRIEKIKL